MGRGKLSQEEIIALNNNPFVVSANENRIIYTNEFKFHFMEQYNNGVRPRKIFSDAGFDVLALGDKRIERAAARWKQSYAAGTLGSYDDPQIRNEKAIKDRAEKAEHINRTIGTQQTVIKKLEKAISETKARIHKQKQISQSKLDSAKAESRARIKEQKQINQSKLDSAKAETQARIKKQKQINQSKLDYTQAESQEKMQKQKARIQAKLDKALAESNEKLEKQAQTISELKAQVELLKKAGSLGRRRCEDKVYGKTDLCELVKSTIEKYSLKNAVKPLCKAVGLARSTFYYYLKSTATRIAAALKDNNLFCIIKTAFENCQYYKKGSRSIKMILSNEYDFFTSRKTIQRIMRKYNLICPMRSTNPYKAIWKATLEDRIAPNLLNRKFKTGIARKVLLTDITYLKHQGAFSYLSLVIDAETNEPISYVLSKSLKENFVLKTLDQLKDIEFPEGAIIHSDQGVHYTCKAFREKIASMNLIQSMSRRGNCLDNAACESFFGHMKQELPDYKDYSFEELNELINKYMYYYRYERYQDNLCNLTPHEYSKTLAA